MAAILDGKNAGIPPENVIMGVPKKGRLYDRCMKLLAGAGMDHRRVRRAFVGIKRVRRSQTYILRQASTPIPVVIE